MFATFRVARADAERQEKQVPTQSVGTRIQNSSVAQFLILKSHCDVLSWRSR